MNAPTRNSAVEWTLLLVLLFVLILIVYSAW